MGGLGAEAIVERLVSGLGLGEGDFDTDLAAADPWVRIPGERLVEAAQILKADPDLAFDTLHCLSGVDWPKDDPPAVEVVYHLFSLAKKHWIVLKTRVPREGGCLPTLENVWKAANWHERECYDLFGVRFEGHSDHRRILLPADWPGHPLLRDWEWPETWHKIPVKPGRQMTDRAEKGQMTGVGPFD